ncbi:hypothetical protein BD626DRAFT_527585, partial [Schizophyllum amplum]
RSRSTRAIRSPRGRWRAASRSIGQGPAVRAGAIRVDLLQDSRVYRLQAFKEDRLQDIKEGPPRGLSTAHPTEHHPLHTALRDRRLTIPTRLLRRRLATRIRMATLLRSPRPSERRVCCTGGYSASRSAEGAGEPFVPPAAQGSPVIPERPPSRSRSRSPTPVPVPPPQRGLRREPSAYTDLSYASQ